MTGLANRAAASAGRSSRRLSTTARTAAAQQEQPQVEYDDDLQPQQLLAALSQTQSYSQLAAFVQSQPAAFLQSPLCVYALLHAVQLRDTLSDEQLGKGALATEDKVLQQMELVRVMLLLRLLAGVPTLLLDRQCCQGVFMLLTGFHTDTHAS
jgi:hypothetical protein